MQVDPAEVGGTLYLADIRLVVGTRPEAIKLAPVARALAARGVRPGLIFTGQHPALDPTDHGLDPYEAVRLPCPGLANPHLHVKSVTEALLPQLLAEPPDLLVVQGDTSSALGAALAGFCAGVAVAHVEAGLRSHNPAMPWPEEEYRTAIDAQASLLFAPTEGAADNLRAEGVPGAIFVTGNSGIDALLATRASLPATVVRDSAVPRLLVTCHRRENWGDGLQAIAAALRDLAADGSMAIDVLLHPNPHVAATMHRLLGARRGIRLLAPCSHAELVERMLGCDLMLSDSGGVQEEAPALGVPLLVLRDATERPEAIATGNMRLIGTRASRIVDEVRGLMSDVVSRARMARPSLPYGDGTAGPRIARIVEQWLIERLPRHPAMVRGSERAKLGAGSRAELRAVR